MTVAGLAVFLQLNAAVSLKATANSAETPTAGTVGQRALLVTFYQQIQAGALARSLDTLKMIEKTDPTGFSTRMAEGCFAFSTGDDDKAMQAYLAAQQNAPPGQKETVAILFEMALCKKEAGALAKQADALAAQNEDHAAALLYEKAWRFLPGRTDLALHAARCYMAAKEAQSASDLLQEVEAHGEKTPGILALEKDMEAMSASQKRLVTDEARLAHLKAHHSATMSEAFLGQ